MKTGSITFSMLVKECKTSRFVQPEVRNEQSYVIYE